jgi:hypothetical protein
MVNESKPSYRFNFLTIFLLTFLFSFSFFRSILVGDEEFVVFAFGPELSANPGKVFDWAIKSSVEGWNTGRFVSPVTHLISNLGTLVGYKTSQFLDVDVITAYALWRSILTSTLALLSMAILLKFIPNNLSTERKKHELTLYSAVFPLTMVANNAWSATRISIWSYHVTLLITLLLLLLFLLVAKFDISQKSSGKVFLVKVMSPALIGIAFATTYELSMVLAPLAVFAFAVTKYIDQHTLGIVRKQFLFFLFSIETIVFSVFFFAFFIPIRLSSYLFCSNNGCYSSANLTPSNFNIIDVAERAVSSITVVSIPLGLSNDLALLYSPTMIIGSVAFGILYAFILSLSFAPSNSVNSSHDREYSNKWQWLVMSIGLLVTTLISVGMGLSEAIQENSDSFNPVSSSIDTLVLNVGFSYIAFALISTLSAKVKDRFQTRHKNFFAALGYSTLIVVAAFAFLANIITTSNSLSEPGKMLQTRFAKELSDPDVTNEGDERRCSYLAQRINDYPNWRGHDGALVWGLNLAMQEKAGVPFCTKSTEELFLNYTGSM